MCLHWRNINLTEVKKSSVSVTFIDEKIRFTPQIKTDSYSLHQILEDTHLFNCSIIGYQTHFTPPSVLDYFERRNFELVRLGRVKKQYGRNGTCYPRC